MIGLYDSLDHVSVQLVQEASDGRETVLKTWTKDTGESSGAA
ncbi:hypothetical protein [Streptomyces albospinus]|nr:hypothetical protein [Streptomyces albospinus]